MHDFGNLVDRIYEAAVDSDLWPDVMHDLARSVDAAGGIILTRRANAWVGWRYSSAIAPGAEAYLRDGATRSQSTARLLALNHAGFISVPGEAFSDDEEYLADPMMAEWSTPAGLHCSAVTAIRAPTDDLVVVQVNRRVGQPRFNGTDVSALDAFRPHLARAGFLAARWRFERLRAAAEALALIGLPAVIVDLKGKALAANSLIGAMTKHVVWLPKDRVALTDAAANSMLRRAVADLSDAAAATVRSFPSRGSAGDTVVVHLIPATGHARDLFDGGFGILTITPVASPCAPDAALIRGLFDLTAAEARVASGVAEGLSPKQIAERHGSSQATVRHQLKSIFARTGVGRQSQLAALLAAQIRLPHASEKGSD